LEVAIMRRVMLLVGCAAVGLLWASTAVAEVGVKQTEKAVEVTLDGQPFATYIFDSGFKPIIWPIIGPTGKEMTRAWPLREGNSEEKTDHVHQKSFWFDHGDIDGIDFWAETAADPNSERVKREIEAAKAAGKEPPKRLWQGKQVHTSLKKAEGGKVGTIVTTTDWIDLHHNQEKMLSDVRTVRFGGDKEMRWIDFDVTVTAEKDGVTFRDTKEGSFGLRIAESMRADKKQDKGTIITSEGLQDAAAWGKPAAWVDYYGPVQGEQLGIAILNHPSSFRYPTHWHVRPYGLFAANPWGLKDFTNGKETSEHTMKKGDSFTLRYRVIFHKGDEKQGKIAEAFANYTKE
jgi:hypothetical protein